MSEADWDYSALPRRKWSWYVEHDPALRCPSDKYVEATPDGLSYTGDCHNTNWGGPYGIGLQSLATFLSDGPLPEQMPEATAAEVRAHLIEHRTPVPRP